MDWIGQDRGISEHDIRLLSFRQFQRSRILRITRKPDVGCSRNLGRLGLGTNLAHNRPYLAIKVGICQVRMTGKHG